MRVWFNRTFSSVYTAVSLIREADAETDYHIIYSNANPHTVVGRVAHEFFEEPAEIKGDAYVDWSIEFCQKQGIDVFWPGREARLISATRERFAEIGTRVLSAAPAEVLELLHDKARFYQSVDLPMAPPAEFRAFNTAGQFNSAYSMLRERHAKLCVKPSLSVYGLGFSVLDEERSCAEILIAGSQYHISLADFRRGLEDLGEVRTMLLMEYLDGHEYSVDCVGDQGKLVCAVPRQKPLVAGRGQLIDLRDDILEATRKLAKNYRLNGVFNVQFREGGGKLRLLEINPRMSGGIGMACMAGPNLPFMALDGFARGFDKVAVPAIRNGIRVAEVSQPVELQ